MNTNWAGWRLTLLGTIVAALWLFVLLSRGPAPPAASIETRTLEMVLEARVRTVASAFEELTTADTAEERVPREHGGGSPPRSLPHDAIVALADEALFLPGLERAGRAGRIVLLRTSALAMLVGEEPTAAELARRADAPELSALLERWSAPRLSSPALSAAELERGTSSLPIGRWLRSELIAVAAESQGDADCREWAGALRDRAVRSEMIWLALVGGGAVIAALVGLGLLLASLLRFGRWFEPGTVPTTRFAGGTTTAAAVCLLWFLAFVAVGTLLALPLSLGIAVPPGCLIVLNSLAIGLAGLALIRHLALDDTPLADALELRRGVCRRSVFWALGMNAVALPLVFGATLLNETLTGPEPFQPAISLLAADPGGTTLVLVAVAVGVVAPFFEELLFRGYLYRVLRTRWGIGGAAAVSAAAFSLAHVSPSLILPLWVLGFLLALAREGSGSMWAPIAGHALWNLGSVVRACYMIGVVTATS